MAAESLDRLFADLAASPSLSDCDVLLVDPPEPAPLRDLAGATRAALRAPLASPPLRELAASAVAAATADGRRPRVAVITSDATRAVPSASLLPVVLDELMTAGVTRDDVCVVIATGAHRSATDTELRGILGDLYGRVAVESHDARAADLVAVGHTRHGTRLLINRTVMAADLRIALGEVEAHEFAGFTGGRKAILPGVTGEATIVSNHALDMLATPRSRPGVLEGNPVHEEMLDAARRARLDFIVNVTIDRSLAVTAVAAGDLEAAHAALVASVRESAVATVPRRPDVIVTGPGPPLDINLYQVTKTLTAIRPIAGPLTAVALVSACVEGVGADELIAPFAGARTPADVFGVIGRRYEVEHNGAFMLAAFLIAVPTVLAACPGVSDEDLRTLLLHPVRDAADGLEQALAVADAAPHGPGARPLVAFIPRAQRLLLSLADA